jgi:hypothetical protein
MPWPAGRRPDPWHARCTCDLLAHVAAQQAGLVMEQQMLMDADAGSAELRGCIEDCERCHRVCLQMAMTYCLEQGGRHVEAPYLPLMVTCADVCRTTADAMLSRVALYEHVCGVCARICEECGASCAELDDMQHCVDVCQQCARSCRLIAATVAPLGSRPGI